MTLQQQLPSGYWRDIWSEWYGSEMSENGSKVNITTVNGISNMYLAVTHFDFKGGLTEDYNAAFDATEITVPLRIAY
jgi:hypothetical protein